MNAGSDTFTASRYNDSALSFILDVSPHGCGGAVSAGSAAAGLGFDRVFPVNSADCALQCIESDHAHPCGFKVQTERTAQLDLQLTAQQQFYEARLTQENELRALRHDMNAHLQTLSTLLNEGRVPEARKYLNGLSQQHRAQPRRVFSGNAYVNAVLTTYEI